ncbi:TPA: hypothetical protein N3288_000217 [Klebsiella aerogenes]|nr:hypothetical protein [Klebsiella aerogenes]
MSIDKIIIPADIKNGVYEVTGAPDKCDFILHEEKWSRKPVSIADMKDGVRAGHFLDASFHPVEVKVVADAKKIAHIAIEPCDKTTGFGAAGITTLYGDFLYTVLSRDAVVKSILIERNGLKTLDSSGAFTSLAKAVIVQLETLGISTVISGL